MSTEPASQELDGQLAGISKDSCPQELIGDAVSKKHGNPTCVSNPGSEHNDRKCDDNVPGIDATATVILSSTVYSGTFDDMAFAADERKTLSGKKGEQSAVAMMDWRPKWLRSEVLAAFTCLFLCMAVGISFVLSYSENKQGVGKARQSFAYIWQFGPTAVLTLISAFWGRVELQAMRYLPWIMLQSPHRPTKDDMNLCTVDYTTMSSPMVIIQSVRRKHHMIYLTAGIGILLKVQIALAPSLFSQITFYSERPTNMMLLNSFSNIYESTSDEPISEQISAHYVGQAIRDFNMLYPLGVSESVAYQTFEANDSGNENSRGTADALTIANVDGLFADLSCFKLDNYSATSRYDHDKTQGSQFWYNLTLHFQGCDRGISLDTHWSPGRQNVTNFWQLYHLPPGQSCSAFPRGNHQFLYLAALLGEQRREGVDLRFKEVQTAAAIICSPSMWLSRIEVTDNGVQPEIKVLPGETKTPVFVDIWRMIEKSFPIWTQFEASRSLGSISGPVAVDSTLGNISDSMNLTFYDSNVLLNSTKTIFANMSPLLGHYVLRQNEAKETMGKVVIASHRLRISQRIGFSMAALFGVMACAACTTLYYFGHGTQRKLWSRDPATILGSILHLRHYSSPPQMTQRLSQGNWGQNMFSPAVLRTGVRATFTLFVIGVAGCLVFLQSRSDTFGGFAMVDSSPGSYDHLLWTTVPALTMLGVSLYVTCCNMELRARCTLWELSSTNCGMSKLDISFLDMLGIRVLFQSWRHLNSYTVAICQFLAIFCAFLPTLASTLFTIAEVPPGTQSLQLRQSTKLGSSSFIESAEEIALRRKFRSLLMRQKEVNLTYPHNTYNDLLFPTLEGIGDVEKSAIVSVEATIPAAQLYSNCTKLSESEYSLDLQNTTDEDGRNKPGFYNAVLRQSLTCPNGTTVVHNITFDIRESPDEDNYSYYGGHVISPTDQRIIDLRCDLYTSTITSRQEDYVWGAYFWGDRVFTTPAAWRCEYAWFEVSTTANIANMEGAWLVDPKQPPQTNSSTRKPWDSSFSIPEAQALDSEMRPISDSDANAFPPVAFTEPWARGLDEQVAVLVRPYGVFDLADLRDPNQEEKILQRLRQNVATLAAQLANVEHRMSQSDNPDTPWGLPEFNATIVLRTRNRLVQNLIPTSLIIAILAAVCAFNIWGLLSAMMRYYGIHQTDRLLDMDVKGLAPEDMGSLEATYSLLHESNAYEKIQNAETAPPSEVQHKMNDLKFRLGWFGDTTTSEPSIHFTVGVLGDENFVFLGSKREVKSLGGSRDSLL